MSTRVRCRFSEAEIERRERLLEGLAADERLLEVLAWRLLAESFARFPELTHQLLDELRANPDSWLEPISDPKENEIGRTN